MKKHYTNQMFMVGSIIIILLGLTGRAAAQTKIFRIQSEREKRIEFVTENEGWIIDEDHLSKTTDGGNSWQIQITFDHDKYYTALAEYSFDFVSGQIGFFTLMDKNTNEQYLFKTIDGGNKWIRTKIKGSNIISTRDVKGITFLSGSYGRAIYNYSNIIGTEDGGANWELLYEGSVGINKIVFADASHGYALSANEVIKTADGGKNWDKAQISNVNYFIDMAVIGSHVWAGTNAGVVYSNDYGGKWSNINSGRNFGNNSYIKMANENYGISDGYYTTDGGNTWTQKFKLGSAGVCGQNIWYENDRNLYKATQNFANTEIVWPELLYSDIVITGGNTVIASATNGSIIKSNDGGITWKWIKDLYGKYNIQDLCFADEKNGIAVGYYLPASSVYYMGCIAVTTDAGETWKIVMDDTGEPFGGQIYSADYTNGTFITKSLGRILKSNDLGRTWSIDPTPDLYATFYQMDFIGDIGFAISSYGMCELFKTTNAGINWSKVEDKTARSVYFLGSGLLWSFYGGKINKSTDMGISWTNPDWGFENIYFKNSDLGIANGYLVKGDQKQYGTYLTKDGGATWEKLTSENISFVIHTIDLISETKGFIAYRHDFYTMLKSGNIDTSETDVPQQNVIIDEKFDGEVFPPEGWTVIQNHSSNTWGGGNVQDHLFSVIDQSSVYSAICPWIDEAQDEWLISPEFSLSGGDEQLEFYAGYSTAYLTDATLKLHVSTNGGASWVQIWEAANDNQPWSWRKQNINISQYSGNSKINLGWQYVGKNGDVAAIDQVKLTGAGKVTDVKETAAVPDKILLEQNYPNPFNPSTTIKFGLPARSNVKIEIYNLLGQRIAQLADGIYEAGYHEIKWNTGGQASGLYLYSITASPENKSHSYRAVKKMLFLK